MADLSPLELFRRIFGVALVFVAVVLYSSEVLDHHFSAGATIDHKAKAPARSVDLAFWQRGATTLTSRKPEREHDGFDHLPFPNGTAQLPTDADGNLINVSNTGIPNNCNDGWICAKIPYCV